MSNLRVVKKITQEITVPASSSVFTDAVYIGDIFGASVQVIETSGIAITATPYGSNDGTNYTALTDGWFQVLNLVGSDSGLTGTDHFNFLYLKFDLTNADITDSDCVVITVLRSRQG